MDESRNLQELLEKFKKIIKVTQRITKDEVAQYLGITKMELVSFIADLGDELPIKINGDDIIVDDFNDFVAYIDEQFGAWDELTTAKIGKLEDNSIANSDDKQARLLMAKNVTQIKNEIIKYVKENRTPHFIRFKLKSHDLDSKQYESLVEALINDALDRNITLQELIHVVGYFHDEYERYLNNKDHDEIVWLLILESDLAGLNLADSTLMNDVQSLRKNLEWKKGCDALVKVISILLDCSESITRQFISDYLDSRRILKYVDDGLGVSATNWEKFVQLRHERLEQSFESALTNANKSIAALKFPVAREYLNQALAIANRLGYREFITSARSILDKLVRMENLEKDFTNAFNNAVYQIASRNYEGARLYANKASDLANQLGNHKLVRNASDLLSRITRLENLEENYRQVMNAAEVLNKKNECQATINKLSEALAIARTAGWNAGVNAITSRIAELKKSTGKKWYHDYCELFVPEHEAMQDIENLLGGPIPLVSEVGDRTFGFISENGHVIKLGLYEKGLDLLPENIGNLTKLQGLYLDKNKLSRIPSSIGKLQDLEKLSLWKNQLTSLVRTIGNLTSLKDLWLSENKLTDLPETIGLLINLKGLDLSYNSISSLPETISKLENLKVLRLNSNKLRSLPETIGQLIKLKELDLSWNQLKSLPETIGNLKDLETLYLSNNSLMSLPMSIGNLKNLTYLNLDYNSLTTLPETIGNLKSLEKLDLEKNNLTSLPGTVKLALKKLKKQGCKINK
ncbi:MAG: leucine-rich repeat domain-containing protein [Promethearchaeota archaeon]